MALDVRTILLQQNNFSNTYSLSGGKGSPLSLDMTSLTSRGLRSSSLYFDLSINSSDFWLVGGKGLLSDIRCCKISLLGNPLHFFLSKLHSLFFSGIWRQQTADSTQPIFSIFCCKILNGVLNKSKISCVPPWILCETVYLVLISCTGDDPSSLRVDSRGDVYSLIIVISIFTV